MEKIIDPKIPSVLGTVSKHLNEQHVPYALIGAMALGLYGFPRYTSDIDLITDSHSWPAIHKTMDGLGYECFQKTDAFAQFDSEMGILGKVETFCSSFRSGRHITKTP